MGISSRLEVDAEEEPKFEPESISSISLKSYARCKDNAFDEAIDVFSRGRRPLEVMCESSPPPAAGKAGHGGTQNERLCVSERIQKLKAGRGSQKN